MKQMGNNRPVIAIDFDGTIHSYEHGWKDGSVYGTPIKGSFQAIRELLVEFEVVIYTARVWGWEERDEAFIKLQEGLIRDWFLLYEAPDLAVLRIVRKFPAAAYIDDRAVPLTAAGEWDKVYVTAKNMAAYDLLGIVTGAKTESPWPVEDPG